MSADSKNLRGTETETIEGAAPSRVGTLNDAEIDAIAASLRAGRLLDPSYERVLFRQSREYELAYAGKESRSQILAETMAVPLQTVKRLGGGAAAGAWTNKLVFGNNLQVLKTLIEVKKRGDLKNADGTDGVRVCYIDPPFATRQEFRGSRGQRAYRDKVAGAEFVEFLRKRLIFIHELLAEDGVLYLHLDTRKAHYAKVVLDEIFGENNFRSEVIWQRTNARSTTEQWPRIHDVLLVYSKTSNYIFWPVEIAADKRKLPHTLITVGGLKYQTYELTAPGVTKEGESGRPWHNVELPPGRHWANSHMTMDAWDAGGLIHWPHNGGFPRKRAEEPFDEEARTVVVGDVWTDIDRINQAAKERTGYPTQKPEALLDRIISSSSNEGDLVLDCFAGSGTTAVSAERLGRRWVAVDCGKLAIYVTQSRLLAMAAPHGRKKSNYRIRPFELCSAGLYDNDLLEQLPYEQFEDFCLELFECRTHEHTIGGIRFAGTRKGAPVHFFPFKATDALMGRPYVESLHDRIGDKAPSAICIVVPVSACEPSLFEDVVTLGEKKKVSYFILRVPYSIIEALHNRGFEQLPQPSTEAEVNDALESYGFDFVQIPEVSAAYHNEGATLRVAIETFMRGGLDPEEFHELPDGGRRDLAMVMVDDDYDGDVFTIDRYFFGADLHRTNWEFEVPMMMAGDRLMVIYLDTHGNERREIIDVAALRDRPRRRATRRKISQ